MYVVPICTTLMSDPVSPITEKSNVTLTCTVEISPSVRELDLALSTLQWILNATLLKPNGNPLAPTGPVINQASRTFTYTVAIDSFRRKNHSGYYFCSVNLTSFNPPYYALNGNTSDTIRVTTGKNYNYNGTTLIVTVDACIL